MLRSGLMSIDPATGFVKAYVGGLNYEYFQHDMCAVGRRILHWIEKSQNRL